nr:MAG TPA: hypothetical protein [Caudoviricetes sp.]
MYGRRQYDCVAKIQNIFKLTNKSFKNFSITKN